MVGPVVVLRRLLGECSSGPRKNQTTGLMHREPAGMLPGRRALSSMLISHPCCPSVPAPSTPISSRILLRGPASIYPKVVRRPLPWLPPSITTARSAPPAAIVSPATTASWSAPNAAITSAARIITSGVRHIDGHLCFERARLQSCQKRPKMSWAIAPGGSLFYRFKPFAGNSK